MLFELSGFLLYYHDYTIEMINKYGKVFGSYGVLEKNLIVNEPELIRQVLVDKYQNCHERRSMYLGPYIKDMLVFLPGDHNWKRLRSLVSPLFSSSKIKSMMSQISEITDRFVQNLEPISRRGDEFCLI